jgi:hypothetical protein
MAGEAMTPPTWREALAMLGQVDTKLYYYRVEAVGISPRDLAAARRAARALETLQEFVRERSKVEELDTNQSMTAPFAEAVRLRLLLRSPDNTEPTDGAITRIYELERGMDR